MDAIVPEIVSICNVLKFLFNEQWKEAQLGKGLRYRYAFSNYGRVVSFQQGITLDGKLLKGSDKEGYPALNMRPNGTSKSVLIHRVVAELFLEKPSRRHKYVIHIDHNKLNNEAQNLRWATKKEKEQHQAQSPLVKEEYSKRKLRVGKGHKLNEDVVKEIKKMLSSDPLPTLRKVAEHFGVSDMQIHRIKTGENWAHVKV